MCKTQKGLLFIVFVSIAALLQSGVSVSCFRVFRKLIGSQSLLLKWFERHAGFTTSNFSFYFNTIPIKEHDNPIAYLNLALSDGYHDTSPH